MKDRIALRMIQQAEIDGIIEPGKTTLVLKFLQHPVFLYCFHPQVLNLACITALIFSQTTIVTVKWVCEPVNSAAIFD